MKHKPIRFNGKHINGFNNHVEKAKEDCPINACKRREADCSLNKFKNFNTKCYEYLPIPLKQVDIPADKELPQQQTEVLHNIRLPKILVNELRKFGDMSKTLEVILSLYWDIPVPREDDKCNCKVHIRHGLSYNKETGRCNSCNKLVNSSSGNQDFRINTVESEEKKRFLDKKKRGE